MSELNRVAFSTLVVINMHRNDAVHAMALPVTSRCSIETVEWIEAFFDSSYCV